MDSVYTRIVPEHNFLKLIIDDRASLQRFQRRLEDCYRAGAVCQVNERNRRADVLFTWLCSTLRLPWPVSLVIYGRTGEEN